MPSFMPFLLASPTLSPQHWIVQQAAIDPSTDLASRIGKYVGLTISSLVYLAIFILMVRVFI
jgi:hypothetical protein